ncbi:hypothetical protein KIN20_024527 [Parelaphostrongylus tenuis]|uniref:Uncharacterized protein n=1 Tax=Parelaphostrongylus tenuis TaxID=148309 RepID=A0AAD5NB83_PARTN|nr:hypothetical protein KIN20_024527 [Parelaphostrongylus tenuis]
MRLGSGHSTRATGHLRQKVLKPVPCEIHTVPLSWAGKLAGSGRLRAHIQICSALAACQHMKSARCHSALCFVSAIPRTQHPSTWSLICSSLMVTQIVPKRRKSNSPKGKRRSDAIITEALRAVMLSEPLISQEQDSPNSPKGTRGADAIIAEALRAMMSSEPLISREQDSPNSPKGTRGADAIIAEALRAMMSSEPLISQEHFVQIVPQKKKFNSPKRKRGADAIIAEALRAMMSSEPLSSREEDSPNSPKGTRSADAIIAEALRAMMSSEPLISREQRKTDKLLKQRLRESTTCA